MAHLLSCLRNLLCILIYLLSISIETTSRPLYVYSSCEKYTLNSKSKYRSNLNTLLQSLSAKAKDYPPGGFYSTSFGNNSNDVVYGLFLCRGDQNATGCGDCVTTAATADLPNVYCPGAMDAVIWYEQCLLRYSNESLRGIMTDEPMAYLMGSESNVGGERSRFIDAMYNTLNSMVADTASNTSGKKFTTKTMNVTNSITLYALAQCTPDLSPNDCKQCLTECIRNLDMMRSSQILTPSCFVRYESFPFFIGAVNYSSLTPSVANFASKGRKKVSAAAIIAIVFSVVAISAVILALGICFVKKRFKKYGAVPIQNGEDFTTLESLQYDLATLQLATNNFSEESKIAEGGFGGVYKGTLSNGQEIAVKRLSKTSGQGVAEFKNEILFIAKLQHRNLVKLLGFCLEGEEKLLVYEYVLNKSLDHYIFDPAKQGQLDWAKRYKIIGGIARGMLYLHEDSRLRIIHRDLKASNVLLDADMNPKVSDFGMARNVVTDQSQGNTSRVVGTYGYMSPEYAMHGKFSIKSDVYSFGVLVLEIISGKKNSSFYQPGYAQDLLSYAWNQWRDVKPLEFVDPTIRDSCSFNEVLRCMHLGLLCVQEAVDERPTMARAMLMLDVHSTVTPPVPKEPAFFIRSTTGSNSFKKGVDSDQSTSKSVPISMNNDDSVTEVEPRYTRVIRDEEHT